MKGDGSSDVMPKGKEEEGTSEPSIGGKKHQPKKAPIEKPRDRYKLLDDAINAFRYIQGLRHRRKTMIFKTRKANVIQGVYLEKKKELNAPSTPETAKKIFTPKLEELKKAEIEKATIEKLKEMYYEKPMHFKEIEEVLASKESKVPPKLVQLDVTSNEKNIFKPYLDRYHEKYLSTLVTDVKKKKSISSGQTDAEEEDSEEQKRKDKIRHDHIISVYKPDGDNLFSNTELKKIKTMGESMFSIKKMHKKDKSKNPREVWEWSEFLDYFVNYAPEEDHSSISESSNDSGISENVNLEAQEECMKKCLINWFVRESPYQKAYNVGTIFRFHESKFPRVKYLFESDEDRLKAAQSFLHYAKVVYPGLNVFKVLIQLKEYTGIDPYELVGDESVPDKKKPLKKPDADMKYFAKLFKESNDLNKIFKKPTVTISTTPKKTSTGMEESLRSLLSINDMSELYEEFRACDLPPPYKIFFIRVANDLINFSQFIKVHPGARDYKNDISNLVKRVLFVILKSINMILETVFKLGGPPEPLERMINVLEDQQMTKKFVPGSTASANDYQDLMKKLMARLIRYMDFRLLVREKNTYISSSESSPSSPRTVNQEKIKDRIKEEEEADASLQFLPKIEL